MTAGFIGRDRELAEPLAGLEDALRGRGRVFLIVGEAGVGKTVLADQLAELAVQHSARAHWGRAWDGGGAPPYWLWAQIIRGIASALRADLDDAGELLDATARAEYKARLDDLREEQAEAESFNDRERAARAAEEIEFLTSELARAVGLGGRGRKAASHSERARLNVTRAIRAALRNISDVHPFLAEHLSHSIRTGRYCCYAPDPRAPIRWEV